MAGRNGRASKRRRSSGTGASAVGFVEALRQLAAAAASESNKVSKIGFDTAVDGLKASVPALRAY